MTVYDDEGWDGIFCDNRTDCLLYSAGVLDVDS